MGSGSLRRTIVFIVLLASVQSSPTINAQRALLLFPSAAKQHTVTLTWKASPSQVSGYNIYRKSKSEKEYRKINSSPVDALTYLDTGVESGRTYHYVVRAVDPQGRESVNSHEFTVTIP
jgi:fibronectin type 3 domain-containing protein